MLAAVEAASFAEQLADANRTALKVLSFVGTQRFEGQGGVKNLEQVLQEE